MSQGHNALTRPGLELGSSSLEYSALTTELLDKAVALVCPWYSWPCMLKVAPCYSCMVVQLYIQIFSAWWVTTILYNYGATQALLWYKWKFDTYPNVNFFSDWHITVQVNHFWCTVHGGCVPLELINSV